MNPACRVKSLRMLRAGTQGADRGRLASRPIPWSWRLGCVPGRQVPIADGNAVTLNTISVSATQPRILCSRCPWSELIAGWGMDAAVTSAMRHARAPHTVPVVSTAHAELYDYEEPSDYDQRALHAEQERQAARGDEVDPQSQAGEDSPDKEHHGARRH